MAKKFLLIGGGFVSLFALAILYWNWSAARDWRRLKADLEAKGETLELSRLLPPAPSDPDNFGSVAPLKDIALVVDGDVEKGEPADRRRTLKGITLKASASGEARPSLQSGLQKGIATDLRPWADEFRKTGVLTMPPATGDAASDLLIGIDDTLPAIKELAAGSTRPESQFTPTLQSRQWAAMLVTQQTPYYTSIQNVANALRLRAIAAAHSSDGQTAAASVLALSKLAEALAHEPFLIANLVSTTVTTMAHSAVWEGLNRRIFAADELKAIQSSLMRHDGRGRLLYALRTELVMNVNTVEQVKAARMKSGLFGYANGLPKVVGILPPGWFDQNTTTLTSLEWDYFIEPLKTSGLQAAFKKSDLLDGVLSDMKKNPLSSLAHFFAHLTLVPAQPVIRRSAYAQSINDLAITATALERFFIKHQKYPASLGDLVPGFLPLEPIDGLNGKPLHYQTTADGRFMIWSEAFDGTDDAGKVLPDPKIGEIGSNLHQRNYKGDWVWQYTRVMP